MFKRALKAGVTLAILSLTLVVASPPKASACNGCSAAVNAVQIARQCRDVVCAEFGENSSSCSTANQVVYDLIGSMVVECAQ